jgi:hypothetical protein
MKTVGVPAGPQGAFVWVPRDQALAHLKQLRRAMKKRGESVLPEAPPLPPVRGQRLDQSIPAQRAALELDRVWTWPLEHPRLFPVRGAPLGRV